MGLTRSEGTLLAGLVAAGAVIAVVASAADSGSDPGGEPAAEASASEGEYFCEEFVRSV